MTGNRGPCGFSPEFHDTLALRVGEEGQGVKTIIDMVHHTRLDTAKRQSADALPLE